MKNFNMLRTIFSVVVIKAMVFSLPAFAQEREEYYWLNSWVDFEAREEYGRAVLYQQLLRAEPEIKKGAQCGEFYAAGEASKALKKDLNRQYRGRANDEYRRLFTQADAKNQRAVANYRACFGNELANYSAIRTDGIGSFEEFIARRSSLHDTDGFHLISNIDDYVRAIESHLDASARGVIAVVISAYGEIEVSHDGSSWRPASSGTKIFRGSHVRSGDKARARIEFRDKSRPSFSLARLLGDTSDNRGPTIVNVAPRSKLLMESFIVNPPDYSNESYVEAVMRLGRGTIRAFTKGWGKRSKYSIRTGTSLCGIRGTEVAVSYNPTSDTAIYHLDHGSAFAQAGGREVSLEPRTYVEVTASSISAPRPFSQNDWGQLVASTGGNPMPGNGGNSRQNGGDRDSDSIIAEQQKGDDRFRKLNEFTRELKSRENYVTNEIKAKNTSENLLHFLKQDNEMGVLSMLGGRVLETYQRVLSEKSLKQLQDEQGTRPRMYEEMCSVCNRAQSKCGFIYEMIAERMHNQRLFPLLIETELDNSTEFMLVTSFTEPRQDQLEWYAKNDAACEKLLR